MGSEVSEARAAYQAAYQKHAQLEERFDAIEQFPDRAAEEQWDARLEASQRTVDAAVERLHELGGRTIEEARATRPSERFEVRSMGDQFGLGESWEVWDPEFEAQVYAFSSPEKAQVYLEKADAKWERSQELQARRAREGSA